MRSVDYYGFAEEELLNAITALRTAQEYLSREGETELAKRIGKTIDNVWPIHEDAHERLAQNARE